MSAKRSSAARGLKEGDVAAGDGAQAMPMPKKPKQPVPKNAVWWSRAKGHPSLRYFGPELYHQRWEKRVWSLSDLSAASGLSKSFLSELENGKKLPSEEVILELEAAMEMEDGGMMRMVRRRWMLEVAKEVAVKGLIEPLAQEARAIRRALRRQTLGLWLAAWLPSPCVLAGWEPELAG